VGFSVWAGISLLLLATGLSVRMREMAARITRWRAVHTFLYWLQYLIVTTVLVFPLTVYRDYYREHAYGLATQSFAGWVGDQLKGLLVAAVLGGLAVVGIYAVVRRATRTWWAWGSAVALAFLAIAIVIAPVYIAPLFNTYTPLQDPAVKEPILRLARANGIPATDVYVFDASRQTTRISANVSGLFGTERISLNDNLLNRCSLPEIEAVMAHEMGHYVLHHSITLLVEIGIVVVLGFAFLSWSFARVEARWGRRWGVRGIGDVAGLPLAVLLLSAFFFVMTPMVNTIIRSHESEADIFGLNAARQPDGFAEAALKLGEYRKLAPGPVEEWIFFDHPSGRTRILMAMQWKAEQPQKLTTKLQSAQRGTERD
jgi:STE24 endopeptidase